MRLFNHFDKPTWDFSVAAAVVPAPPMLIHLNWMRPWPRYVAHKTHSQLDMITDVFNRLVESCHAKCISPRYAEADLNKGESVCVDRYVSC